MNTNISKIAQILILLSFGLPSIFAQKNSGTLVYEFIQESGNFKEFTMHFTPSSSLAYTERGSQKETKRETLPHPTKENNYVVLTRNIDEESTSYYRNLKDSLLVSRKLKTPFDGNYFLVRESVPTIDWKISEETEKLGGFTCHKAEGEYKGRTYTAWFTYEIPVSHGPWKLSGLPGLILEAYNKNGDHFRLKSLTFEPLKAFKYPIEKPKIGTQITWEEQVAIILSYHKRMQKQMAARQAAAEAQGKFIDVNTSDIRKTHIEGPAFAEWERKQKSEDE